MDTLNKPENASTSQQLENKLNIAFKKSGMSAERFFKVISKRPAVEDTDDTTYNLIVDAWAKGDIFRFSFNTTPGVSKHSRWLCQPCPAYCTAFNNSFKLK